MSPLSGAQKLRCALKRRRYLLLLHDAFKPHCHRLSSRLPALDLGYFSLMDQFPQRRIHAVSEEECYHQCFLRAYQYAGYVVDFDCYCSRTLENVATSKEVNAANSADLAKIRSIYQKVHIFKRRRKCRREFTQSFLKTAKLGCISAPTELSSSQTAIVVANASSEQCILACESRDYAIALSMERFNACVCSDIFSIFRFPADMGAAASACPKDEMPTQPSLGKLVEVYQTLADRTCGHKKFPQKKETPAVLLTSLPGSGNTWLRHLIESVTGFYTGSAYSDKALYDGGFLGEYLSSFSGRTLVIKDHLFEYKIDPQYKSAISLVRNIYDVSLADFARIAAGDHAAAVDNSIYKSERFRKFALNRPKTWLNTQKYVLENISPVIVVYFEDLVQDPVKEMRRIASFLPDNLVEHTGIDFEKRLMCMLLDINGNFKRPRKLLDFDPFDDQIRKHYSTAIRDMDRLMKIHGQSPLPISYFASE